MITGRRTVFFPLCLSMFHQTVSAIVRIGVPSPKRHGKRPNSPCSDMPRFIYRELVPRDQGSSVEIRWNLVVVVEHIDAFDRPCLTAQVAAMRLQSAAAVAVCVPHCANDRGLRYSRDACFHIQLVI